MSRLGVKEIELPKEVEVKMTSDGEVNVKGPKGALAMLLPTGITINIEEKTCLVKCDIEQVENKSYHGLYRSLLSNMIVGVHKGYEKRLVLIGTGYRAAVQGTKLELKVGYSHPTILEVPSGLKAEVGKDGVVTISGFDKQKVGEYAAKVRALRPPEPYKGKGIRYEGEYVRKKAGKSAKK